MPSKKTDKNGRTAKHSASTERANKEVGYMRSQATVKRLKMYNSGKAVRDKKGKVVSQELQSKALPSTRIVPDRRWFGNTRVVGAKQLESFREQMADKADNPFMVLVRERKLPMQLLEDPEAKVDKKRKRKEVLQQMTFSETFGAKSGQRQKRPKLAVENYEELVDKADQGQQGYLDKHDSGADAYAHKDEREFATVRQKVLDKGQSRRIWAELYKVVDSSDVIIQVLDARDPDGTRCKFLEQHIKHNHKHKHMIFLLNKVDLVPQWNAKRWLHHLSKSYPVLAFHSSLTNPFGKGALLSLLRQLARLRSDKRAISVGFVGYPNVGKSSVINTLRTKKVCTVAPVPGETKVWQYITLMKRVYLIDCPGVVYNETNDDEVDTVLKGVVRIERLEDATVYVPAVLQRVKLDYLKRAYRLKHWENAEDFLAQIARSTGKLGNGGDPDLNTAAKMVLLDWQKGKLPYFTTPPGYSSEPPSKSENLVSEERPALAVTAEEAREDGEGSAEHAIAAAEQLAEGALAAVVEQQRAAIPMRGEYFSAEDAGPEAPTAGTLAAPESDVSGSEDASDSDGASDEGFAGDRNRESSPAGGEAASDASSESDDGDEDNDEEEEEGGYGEGGLTWQAVMEQIAGQSTPADEEAEPSGLDSELPEAKTEQTTGRGTKRKLDEVVERSPQRKRAKGTKKKGKHQVPSKAASKIGVSRKLTTRKALKIAKLRKQ